MNEIKNKKLNDWVHSIKKNMNLILNILFPPRCVFCSRIMNWSTEEEELLCPDCLSQIPFIDTPGCNFCGKRLEQDTICSCRLEEDNLFYSKAYSACEYKGIIRNRLLDFKFSNRKGLSKVFAGLIIRKLQMTNEKTFDIIISVPIHEVKFEKRGYNQSELISEHIAKYYLKPLVKKNLVKTRETHTQSKLHKKDRVQNIKNAFEIILKEEVIGKNILLIDDILTTGSTVNECSKVLMQNGAKEVIVATVATGKTLND